MSVGDLLDFPELPSVCPLPSLVGSQAPFQYSEPYQPPVQCILGLCVFTFLALLSFLDQTPDRPVATVYCPLRNTSLFLRTFCAHPLPFLVSVAAGLQSARLSMVGHCSNGVEHRELEELSEK